MEKYHLIALVVLTYSTLSNGERFFTTCPTNSFECTISGECIPKNQRCDGRNNCKDWSDEKDCGRSNEKGKFKMWTNASIFSFVLDKFLCNPPTYFRCKNSECVKRSMLCDGENDCMDFSDEMNCSSTNVSSSRKLSA